MAQNTDAPPRGDAILRSRVGDMYIANCMLEAQIGQMQAALQMKDAELAEKDRVIDALSRQRGDSTSGSDDADAAPAA